MKNRNHSAMVLSALLLALCLLLSSCSGLSQWIHDFAAAEASRQDAQNGTKAPTQPAGTDPSPSQAPTAAPTQAPTAAPTQAPTAAPTRPAPTDPAPTRPAPTDSAPTRPTQSPTQEPTQPVVRPTGPVSPTRPAPTNVSPTRPRPSSDASGTEPGGFGPDLNRDPKVLTGLYIATARRYFINSVYTEKFEDDYAGWAVMRTLLAGGALTEDHPALATSLNTLFAYPDFNLYNLTIMGLQAEIEEDIKDFATFSQHYHNETLELRRADEIVLSLVRGRESYQGGMHVDNSFTCVNIDSVSGESLGISDVFTSTRGLAETITLAVSAKYLHFRDESASILAAVRSIIDSGMLAFTIDYPGITFWFPARSLDPWDEEVYSVFVSYQKLEGLVNERFTYAPSAYSVSIPLNHSFWYADASGEHRYYIMSEPSPAGTNVIIYKDDKKDEMPLSDGSLSADSAFLIHAADGSDHIMVIMTGPNLYTETLVFSEMRAEFGTSYVLASREQNLGPESFVTGPNDAFRASWAVTGPELFRMQKHLDIFSTYDASAPYLLTTDARPVRHLDETYTILEPRTLTLKQSLTANLESADYQPPVTLPAGTKLTFESTNAENRVVFALEDGRRVYFYMTLGTDYVQRIGTTPIDQLFDGLFFAG
ncbi:MAG: hypothetical protein ILP12_01500 [Lachnospiraceae bacterium]|nr:hypothetical protein [Lachnospiraceae bacterium]